MGNRRGLWVLGVIHKLSTIVTPSLDTPAHSEYNTHMKKPRMTRAHYTFLAQFIDDYAKDSKMWEGDHIILASRMQQALMGTNDNFDGERFCQAATASYKEPKTEMLHELTPEQKAAQ